ncbi:guanine nucleotide-releasing factor 2 isoform X8 [Apis dorsata]|uniref:guanine nucleotide-releasing factor 2 isoform X8 n=1 Tax=Apis dorsata TaxID=7462 RepID=UPI0012939D81|nr:guanine nucleotide-releasing factor 2 isoform X8 [Apis dorsata]
MPQYDDTFLDSPIFRRRTRSYAVQKEFAPKSSSFVTATPLLLAVTNHARTLSGSLSTCSLKEIEERSGGKARGGKLARRARSFKEDFLEKLSHMRSPGSGSGGGGSGGATRAASPSSPRTPRDKSAPGCTDATLDKNPLRDLHIHVRQVQLALLHFKDVVLKKKLEMLPGNGTIILDHITTIHTVLKSYLLYENSSTLGSATNQVYQALAQLLKLCDDVLLHGDQSSALDTENVTHIIGLVEDAVKNLVDLANEKIANRQKPAAVATSNRTNVCLSEENSSSGTPPPLPPKRRTRAQQLLDESEGLLASSLDGVSLRSRSPEDSSSLLSASAGSLDSALNHSRDEDEIRAIMGPNDDSLNDSMDLSLMATIQGMQVNGSSNCSCWDGSETNIPSTMLLGQQTPQEVLHQFTGIEGNRLSTQTQESGFVSMHSQRSSSQSYTTTSSITSKRSSQQSSISYNSQTFNSQQSFSQTKLSSDSNGSIFTQKTMTSSKSTVSTNISGSGDSAILEKLVNEMESISTSDTNGVPPALPEKRSKRRKERQPSQYDNVPENEHLSTCSLHTNNGDNPDANKPPPLPLKKRHMFQSVAYSVMAYMEMFGNCSHSNNDFISGLGTRHSVAAYNSMLGEWQNDMALTTTQSCSFMAHTMTTLHDSSNTSITMTPSVTELTNNSSLPPALPPKRSRSIKSNATPPPISPKPTISMQSIHTIEPIVTSTPVKIEESGCIHDKKELTPSTPVKLNNVALDTILPSSRPASNALSSISVDDNTLELRDIDQDDSILDELDISKYLVFKKPDEEGPDIRGGHPDALLIHATKANKHDEKESDFLYQEAFLTTYRTFMQPLELIQKLHKRHQRFSCSADVVKQRAAREAFSLLVRAVSDLTMSDLDDTLLQTLMEFVQQLVCSGDLTMAKALRVKILEKHAVKQLQSAQPILSSLSVTTKQASLLDFKSEQIAEQMTLLDADLFMKIEIPEVLIWAQEQNEERSPNLTRFTEHFNKMSYWARSRILEHRLENEAKDREKYVVKFIKIMKHLRKINNFNSYLALLSALDSAPIRRLEWQKHITEGLKEYCALIDSSSSFRAYRQALAETQPPCIPYIGLVLQDLTFVHIGNSDLLPDGSINFSKRWQQFNIVENMKRFKKGTYSFKKHERIITFFNNFSDFLCEEAMWQISESIKPRGGKKAQSQN